MFKIYGFVTALVVMITVSSCTIEDVDTDFGEQIEGTYSMTYIETQTQLNKDPSSNNRVIITRLGDKSVEITLTFANENQDDLVSDDVTVSKSGDTFKLSKSYTNAELTGEVNGDNCEIYIDYEEENEHDKDRFLDVRAEK